MGCLMSMTCWGPASDFVGRVCFFGCADGCGCRWVSTGHCLFVSTGIWMKTWRRQAHRRLAWGRWLLRGYPGPCWERCCSRRDGPLPRSSADLAAVLFVLLWGLTERKASIIQMF